MAPDETNTVDEKQTTQTTQKKTEKSVNPSGQDTNPAANESLFDVSKLGILNDVAIVLTIEIGRTQIKIRDLLNLTKDSILDLNKQAGEPVDIYANGKLIAKGNIITANGKYCVRLVTICEQPQ